MPAAAHRPAASRRRAAPKPSAEELAIERELDELLEKIDRTLEKNEAITNRLMARLGQ